MGQGKLERKLGDFWPGHKLGDFWPGKEEERLRNDQTPIAKNRRRRKQTMEVKCLNCGGIVTAELKHGDEIYKGRKDLHDKLFWQCKFCGGYVGTHPHTINPLGSIPTEDVRRMRLKVHSLIDPLWKGGYISRGEIYKRLSSAVGHQFHNGTSESVDELKIAYREGEKIKEELFGKNGIVPHF